MCTPLSTIVLAQSSSAKPREERLLPSGTRNSISSNPLRASPANKPQSPWQSHQPTPLPAQQWLFETTGATHTDAIARCKQDGAWGLLPSTSSTLPSFYIFKGRRASYHNANSTRFQSPSLS